MFSQTFENHTCSYCLASASDFAGLKADFLQFKAENNMQQTELTSGVKSSFEWNSFTLGFISFLIKFVKASTDLWPLYSFLMG